MRGARPWTGVLGPWVGLCAAFSTATAAPPERGHIQVKTVPGVRVTLEARAAAVADAVDGVTFRDVPPGVYTVRAERDGFAQKSAQVTVEPGTVSVLRLFGWQPSAPLETETGGLVVQTFPVDATISARTLGWKNVKKGDDPFVAGGLPAGEHKLTFCNAYKCIDHRVEIPPGEVLSLLVDFDPGEVANVTRQHRARLAQWRRRCHRRADLFACQQLCSLVAALGAREKACAASPDDPEHRRVASGDEERDGEDQKEAEPVPASTSRSLP